MDASYRELLSTLRRVGVRLRALTVLRACAMAGAAAAAIGGLAVIANWLLAPRGMTLVLLWMLAMVTATAVAIRLLLPIRRRASDAAIARYIEECCPELDDTLATAVAEAHRHADHPLIATVVADAARRAAAIDLDRTVSVRRLRAAALHASAAAIAVLAVAVLAARPIGDAVHVLALYVFPQRLVLDVVPGDAKVREGDTLRIIARMPGDAGTVVPMLRISGADETPMQAEDGGYVATINDVQEAFAYSVSAAATTSREFTVSVLRLPHVERIDLRYEFPSAFRMEPRIEEDGGDIYGPAGTRVRLVVHTDKPVINAELTLPNGQRIPLHGPAEAGPHDLGNVGAGFSRPITVLEGELTITADGSYRVALADADGLANPGDTEYFIRTLQDRPPDVRITRPASDRQVSPLEEVPVEARADDDFGIAAFDLVYSVRGGEERVVPFQRRGEATTLSGQRTIYLEDLGVAPGDFVTYYARARDISRGKRPTEARSDIFFLEVKPFEEEFVAAQSQGSGGAGSGPDRSLEALIDAQKDVITATWKLDRRGRDAGSQSAEDIRNVARAQSEVRRRALGASLQDQRAEELRRRLGGQRGRGGVTPGDAMTRAMEAMDKAHSSLEQLKTSAALPHEMTALNELLRAQAEVRRREVQRQEASNTPGGGPGSNRQTQDLSSLFDRELARQQQTNYETPTSTETREQRGEAGSDALDKIKELARRQQALNRTHEDLARARAGLSDDAVKRQLERLTREQNELRQEAEDLARQMDRDDRRGRPSGRPDARGGGSSTDREASRELQKASEEMKGAASGMRRQDPSQAGAGGSRALERLRDVERRLEGARPGERRRQDGERGGDGKTPQSEQLSAELSRARELRDKLAEVDRQLAEMQRQGRSGSEGRGQREGRGRGDGRGEGNSGGRGPGRGSAQHEGGEWEQAREVLDQLRREKEVGLSTRDLQGFNPGISAPGTEAWKQDFAKWEQLRAHAAAALEKLEASAARRLREQQSKDRLNAGATQAVPAAYRDLVNRYYRALAQGPDARRAKTAASGAEAPGAKVAK